MKTLSEFIEEQIYNYDIEDTSRNKKKLRIKFVRELKKLNLWENAQEKIVGKAKTKVFSKNELSILLKRTENYLIKQSGISLEEYKRVKKENLKILDKQINIDYEEEKNNIYQEYPDPSIISSQEKVEVMVSALFEKFFTPINVEQWQKDKNTVIESESSYNKEDRTAINVLQANIRLESHNKNAYYQEKNYKHKQKK
jgi:DNA-directed RNA polymerase subunit L